MRPENTPSRNLVRSRARARVIDRKTGLITLAGALILLTAAVLMLSSGTAWGVSAAPDPVIVRQPDGAVITLYLMGDEHFHWNEDATGFPVVRLGDGRSWVYAIEQLGQLVPSSIMAGSADPLAAGLPRPDIQRLRGEALKNPRIMLESEDVQRAPSASTMYNLVVLVNYTDLTITSTRQEFDDLFNQIGYTDDGATGSVRDYYNEVSYGELAVISTVVEPVTVSEGYAYYGANSGGWDIRPREMVSEALAALEARGFDFSSVDGDGDGWVDGLTIIHAGGGEEYSGNDPDYIWSHAWALVSTVTYDGTRMRSYHTEPARRGYDSNPASWGITRIGVICHETGHFLGLPDLYDYGYDSRGVGLFCIMAGGSWGNGGATPVHFSAWCKSYLGWVTPTEITTGGPYSLSQVETSQDIYKLQGPFASNEYFLVENRQGVGFDVSLPGTERGILIWHVDENQSNNDDQTHYLVDLEEASGTQHLELNQNSGEDSDYYRSTNVTEFTMLTTPDNLSYGGTPLGLDIRMVSESGSLMSFIVNGMSIFITAPVPAEVVDVDDIYRVRWTVSGATPDSVSIVLSIDSGMTWPDTIATGLAAVNYFDWTVPNLPVPTVRLKVIVYTGDTVVGFDEMDGDFTIQGAPYRYVSTTGGDIYPYSLPAWAAHTIEDAIYAAIDGDSVMVETGTYSEKVTVMKKVHLMGGWNTGFTLRDPDIYPSTINSNGSTVSFLTIIGEGCGIEGFTITGGTGTTVSLPAHGLYGGGVFSYNASPLIKDNTINSCGYVTSSGYSAGGGISCYLGNVEITGNTINGCVAQSGGGIYLYQTSATLTGNTISGSQPHATYTGTRNGGGLCSRNSTVTMSGNVITGNTGFMHGGGISFWLGSASLQGDTISSNSCTSKGGGVMTERTALDARHAVITGNSAALGGGIYHKAAAFDMANSLVALNTSSFDGGVSADSCWGTFENNTIDGNISLNEYGTGNMMLINSQGSIIRNNHFTSGTPTGFQASPPDNITYAFNNAYNNPGGDVVGLTPDGTNMSADPLFVDLPGADYHLALYSPGIDAGDPAGGNDPDGSRADIGMFGGPDAAWLQPDAVQNCVATASSDTTITVTWDAMLPAGGDHFAVFGDIVSGFAADAASMLGIVPIMETSFDHHPVEGCWYYKVCAVNTSEYSGGYSNEAGDCAAGPDLVPPTVAVTYPNGGEAFAPGDTINIQWTADDNRGVDSVSIYYSENAGAGFTLLASGKPNDLSFEWIAPDISSDSCLVRVVAFDPGLLTADDVSDSLFAIRTVSTDGELPAVTWALSQNFPNPFNPLTTIHYDVKAGGGQVNLRIFDVSGRVVRTLVDGHQTEGARSVNWNGTNDRGQRVASGIYFYRMTAQGFTETKKMVLLR